MSALLALSLTCLSAGALALTCHLLNGPGCSVCKAPPPAPALRTKDAKLFMVQQVIQRNDGGFAAEEMNKLRDELRLFFTPGSVLGDDYDKLHRQGEEKVISFPAMQPPRRKAPAPSDLEHREHVRTQDAGVV